MAMLALGQFVFALNSAPFQQWQRQLAWRHPSQSRVGARPARQFLGPDDEPVTLSGSLYPELTGGPVNLEQLRDMGDSGKTWPLIDGDGKLLGLFVIENLHETRSEFFIDGTARKIEFSLTLQRVDDDNKNIGQPQSARM